MIQVTYFINCYFMCDIKHHSMVLCTVLQLPHSLKCKRELTCPCRPPHLFLVSEILQEAQHQGVTGGRTQQQPYHSINPAVMSKPFQLLQSMKASLKLSHLLFI